VPWFRDLYAAAVWDCEALRPNEKLVALVYADHAGDPENPGNDVAWVVWRRLSGRTGIRSKTALSNALKGLQAAGWLVLIEGRKQHYSPRYRLVIPERPEVRETYVWDGEQEPAEVHEADNSPVENPAPEVHETDNWESSEVAPVDNNPAPVVHETTPVVHETTARGPRNGPDFSNNPSTTDNPPSLDSNHRTRETTCKHKWTADGDCLHCSRHEPCPDCRRLARIGPDIRCYQHQDHQEAS